MAVIAKGLKKKGLSQESVNLALKARRPSTNVNYNYKWTVWTTFCAKRNKPVDPLYPKPVHMADFLSFLYKEKNLTYATLCNYRSAVCNTIMSARACDVSHLCSDPLVRQVLSGVKNEFPTKQIQAPLWDVYLVLKYLRGPTFEPLSSCSLRKLSQKALFLTMFACARRISGIHALSGLDKDIEFAHNDTTCNLSFLPEFRAKNQDALSDSQTIEIKSLSQILGPDDEDRLNCPVRVIKRYLTRTAEHRLGKRRFFLAINPAYKKDITKNTLATWIRDLLHDAYQDAHLAVPSGTSRTHEVRKVSTSLGYARNVSMANLMRAAYWRSESTFTLHYLRDIRVRRNNDTFGINKVVAAGSLLDL